MCENSGSLRNSHEKHGWHNACDPFRAVRAEEVLISSEDGERVARQLLPLVPVRQPVPMFRALPKLRDRCVIESNLDRER